jgi:hypothetical protein
LRGTALAPCAALLDVDSPNKNAAQAIEINAICGVKGLVGRCLLGPTIVWSQTIRRNDFQGGGSAFPDAEGCTLPGS